jgi:DNA helicase-2/ATP-dependent DNA helicase PcrA
MSEVGFPYLDQLNDIQRAAVMATEGPVMVIAGPGSGKTRVLTFRIAHLMKIGVAPWHILALTFTNKAAREMKDRIEKVVGPMAYKVWAGTFHSLFSRILRVEAHHLGYPNDFTIYDTDDSKSVIRQIIKSLKLDSKVYNVSAMLSRISHAKSNLITPKAYATNEELMSYDRMNRRPMTQMIYEKYVNKCQRSGAMDFDDLLLQMFRLLYQNPENVRAKYQYQFRYVMVDEFQDTNFLQYEILKLLTVYNESAHNICIVGDDAQSIYSFRGATIENILQFTSDYPDVQTYKLEQNYRSTTHIIETANEIINYNKKQIPKKIWTDKPEGQKIKIIKAMSDSEEGRRIADSIIEQKHRFNLANKQIAILYRTNAQSRVFEEHLRRQNIPYRIYGGLSFYSRKEIKDMIAYLRLAVNYKDDEAFKRVINYPRRGLGNKTIEQIIQIADDNDISMMEVLMTVDLTIRAKQKLTDFVKMIGAFKRKAESSSAFDTALYISRQSGIMDLLKSDTSPEGMGRVENLNALLDGIKDFTEDDVIEPGEEELDRSLAKFLQTISLMTDADADDGSNDTITMMSVHAAKGLEFRSIFVVGLEENLFPSYMSLSSPDQIDEERRLFYVAITRAEEYLTLSYANSRYTFGQMRFNDPSRFLEEIPDKSVDAITAITKKKAMEKTPFGQPKILGNFKPIGRKALPKVDATDFKADPASKIQVGMQVKHLRFGVGEVISIDARSFATIHFPQVSDNKEKRIALQYAKLQILG